MATDNLQRYGLRFHRSRAGSNTPHVERYRVASGYQGTDVNSANCDLNVGDPVKKVNDGTVALAAGGDAVFGVIANILPYSKGDGIRPYKNLVGGSTGTIGTPGELAVEIILAADNLFEIDCNDNTTETTLSAYTAIIGENANHINTGDTTNKTANPQLNISGHATTNTLQWRIVDISPTNDNVDPGGKYFKLIVTGNVVQQAPFQTTGV